jgi:hypothetical protein
VQVLPIVDDQPERLFQGVQVRDEPLDDRGLIFKGKDEDD